MLETAVINSSITVLFDFVASASISFGFTSTSFCEACSAWVFDPVCYTINTSRELFKNGLPLRIARKYFCFCDLYASTSLAASERASLTFCVRSSQFSEHKYEKVGMMGSTLSSLLDDVLSFLFGLRGGLVNA